MSTGKLAFLLFAGALGLWCWTPDSRSRGFRMLLWAILSALSCIALLFSLFTVWWPPTQTWSIVWSLAAMALLLLIALANTEPADWLP